MLKITLTHEGSDHAAHQSLHAAVEAWAREHLGPLLAGYPGDLHLHATVKHHSKGAAKCTAHLRLHLPRKDVLVAHGEAIDIQSALAEAEKRLLREVKKHKERLHGQADYRRKARRARLRQLKVAQAAVPEQVQTQTRHGIEPLLPQLTRIVRRELAYLRASGELPSQDPSVQDVVDEAVLSVLAQGQADRPAETLLRELLREAFRVLDAEVEARRRHGEIVSLQSSPEQDAIDQAEAMVQEELYEFYQPDEALQLSDVVADDTLPAIETDATCTDDTSARDYGLGRLVGLPIVWRRVWMLAELERLAMADIAAVLDLELAHAERLLAHARAFFDAHLRQAGF
ncbi:HPF/RaiA family ribosome-associated protein [Thermomonas hydrothermalis]|uniref:Sigma 54 modulation protein / S30EA ribosomal protein n=1 Tax=Thermomonas hydrothermalis TaxID=213588 RepID=A0A1M4ZZ66_9GAMM|nr:HPF/RaiA family ribosome-associated protein [Thermomonas hydrothermalis]MCL6618584.1 HPF/RaiA family ribosome-associated protein [Thermomonas hydrothermalis]SHF23298.1 Sigma 54 modulation protein / S30EA ribosomal protein [Thermomonas hydrothermalis]